MPCANRARLLLRRATGGRDDMEKLYPHRQQAVNGTKPELPDPTTLTHHLRIHPALAMRRDISRGARELFAWIEALFLMHGRNDPTTKWLTAAIGDSNRQIARALAELGDAEIIRVLSDGHNRQIRIAEHMSPPKDSGGYHDKNGNVDAGNHDENVRDSKSNHDKNGNVLSGNHDKNGMVSYARVRLRDSDSKNYESKPKTPESCRSIPKLLSPEDKAKVAKFSVTVNSNRVMEFESLLLSAIERGRTDAWDAAAEVTVYDVALGANRLQGRVKDPLAFFRKVLLTNWEMDRTLLEETISDWRLKQNPQAQRKNADWDSHLAREKAAHNGPVTATVKEMVSKTAKPMPIPNGTESSSSYRQYIPPTVMTTQNAPQTVPDRQEAVPGRQECQAYYDALDADAQAALDAQALADTLPTSRHRHRFVRENRNNIIAQKIIADKIIAARSETEFSL